VSISRFKSGVLSKRSFLSGNTAYDPLANARGIFAGGYTNAGGGSVLNVIDYVEISTTGNSTDFGDLTVSRYGVAGCASSTRGLIGGGDLTGPSPQNVIDYITIASTGNATDFGDLTASRGLLASCSSSTRGVWFGGGLGFAGNSLTDVIDYVTIATTGNATSFGTLPTTQGWGTAGCSSSTRGLMGGGATVGGEGNTTNVINYVTIASTGNGTDFGDLTVARNQISSGISSATRGIWSGGSSSNVIDYVTIASIGNATDFGDLLGGLDYSEPAGCASSIRGLIGGGAFHNTIQYITIATTGNATDFGDLTVARYGLAALSNGHGGLAA